MLSLAAWILSVAKAIPAVEAFIDQFISLYADWKRSKNEDNQKLKDLRNNAAVDAALRGEPVLCSACPFSPHNSGGQHGGDPAGSGVPGNGAGGT